MPSENFLRNFFSMGKNPIPIEPWEVMKTIAAQWMKNDKAAQQNKILLKIHTAGGKAPDSLIQKFERVLIEENDGSFNPQKKIPLAQIIEIIRQHEAALLDKTDSRN